MELTAAIQEALVCLLCYAESPQKFGHVRSLVDPTTFDSYFRQIASASIEYFDRYGKAPGDHTLDLVDALKGKHPEEAKIYDRIYKSLLQTKDGINYEYVVSRATLFTRHQKMVLGITKALEVIQSGGDDEGVVVDSATKVLQDSLQASISLFDPGTILTDTDKSLLFLEKEDRPFLCGVPALDAYNLGPARKRMHVFAAVAGFGKSWWLVNLAKHALLQRAKVLYVTLELSEAEVSMRLFQSIFSMGKRKVRHHRQRIEVDDAGKFVSLTTEDVTKRPHMDQEGIRRLLEKKIQPLKNKPRIIVKEFPTGALSVKELEGFLDGLETSIGFIPDLILIDYADLMRVDSRNYRHELGSVYKDLRGLAVKRKVAVATASQLNREAMSVKVATMKHLAEDISKAATADIVLTYNQTEDEAELGLARIFVAKARTDQSQFAVLISQAYSLGQFCFDSAKMDTSYWDHIKSGGGEDDQDVVD